MRPLFLFRLFLDFLAVSMLLAAFAYNGTGNLAHEIAGTTMFLLLIAHNVFNRRWYGTLTNGRREARGLVTKTVNLSLLAIMLSLAITSLIISQSVFGFLPIATTFIARQIHTLVGYGALLIAAIHLGLHWSMIMGVVRNRLGIATASKADLVVLQALTGVIAAYGIYSLFAVDVVSKLAMEVPTGFGAYEIATSALITHHAAIVGLCASIVHYGLKAFRRPEG